MVASARAYAAIGGLLLTGRPSHIARFVSPVVVDPVDSVASRRHGSDVRGKESPTIHRVEPLIANMDTSVVVILSLLEVGQAPLPHAKPAEIDGIVDAAIYPSDHTGRCPFRRHAAAPLGVSATKGCQENFPLRPTITSAEHSALQLPHARLAYPEVRLRHRDDDEPTIPVSGCDWNCFSHVDTYHPDPVVTTA